MARRLQLASCTAAIALYAALSVNAQNPVSGVFFNEGWESGTMTQSFNSAFYGSAAPPQFSVQNAFFASGTQALRHRLSAGMTGDDVAYATQHFGDARATPKLSVGSGQHFYDLYIQYKVFYSSNWDSSPGGLTKGLEFGTEDDRAHPEICCNPGFANYVATYPPFGNAWNLEVVNKQGPSNQWIGYNQNASGYSTSNIFRIQTGRWYTFEVRRRLNDAGVDNGVLQMWVDGMLLINYSNVRFRVPWNGTYGANMTYGTNFVMISEYGPSNRDESVYYDDFKLSTTYIGTGGNTGAPRPPTNVRIIR
jgi:hypothetical protein